VLGIVPAFIGLAWPAPVLVIVFAMVLSGICISVADITFQTALQRNIPPEALSRVMSYDTLGSFVFLPLGMATIAPISDVVGVRATLLGAAAIIVIATLAALAVANVRSVRQEDGSQVELRPGALEEATPTAAHPAG
jgi:hypothetical protein